MISSQNLNILTKALPHLPERARMYVDVILKLNQLKMSVDSLEENDTIHMMQSGNNQSNSTPTAIDIDSLFKDIRPLCSGNDAKMIDMYLNLKKSRDIINAYQAMNGGDIFGSF